jgi:hypothetical protein
MTTTRPTITRYEDHEGDGTCGACGREGLRWIARLSDGSGIGTECAKAVLGYTVARKDYAWTTDFAPVATVVEYGETLVLWQSKSGSQTRETRDGRLVKVGGARKEWQQEGRL